MQSTLTISRRFGYLRAGKACVKTLTTIIASMVVTSGVLWAQTGGSSVTQSVTIEVKAITKISVSGDPGPLIINEAATDSNPLSVRDDKTSYSLTTNLDMMKIVASIDNRMPDGTRLMVNLASSKGQSAGTVDLSDATNPVDVVTGIGRCSQKNETISYTFAAAEGVNDVPLQARVVTLTLTD